MLGLEMANHVISEDPVAALFAIHHPQRLTMLSEAVLVVEAPDLESSLNPSLTPRTSSWVASEWSQTEMGADVGNPTMRTGFEVGTAIEWALPSLSLERLEERIPLLHPERVGNLYLQARRDIVILREELWFEFVLTEPWFCQDTE